MTVPAKIVGGLQPYPEGNFPRSPSCALVFGMWEHGATDLEEPVCYRHPMHVGLYG